MKKLNYILILMMGLFLFSSCEEDTFIKDIKNGENLAAFTSSEQSVMKVANGEEYTVQVPMKIEGPSALDLTGDYVVTVQATTEGIPDASKAVEGTHYRLDENQVTLTQDTLGNYEGVFEFTMLTQGLSAPLDNSPKFTLKLADVSGSGNVINSGKPLDVTLNYACPSELEGLYAVTVNSDTVIADVPVVKLGIGEYDTNLLGRFGRAHQPPNNFSRGIIINDVCGTISVPNQTLAQFTGYSVAGNSESEVVGDPEVEGGVVSFFIDYTIDGFGAQESDFVYTGPLPE